ncbi:MAG: sigma-70 family RNA polymerase sigma factor [Acidimicrobiales bacterium]
MATPPFDDAANRPETRGSAAAAFERHVLPELDLLYRTARSLTGNQADAEDLVQDTLIRAFGAIERFDGRYPRAWLLTIMRNANINRARKKKPDLLDDPDLTFERSLDFAESDTPESITVAPVFDAAVEDAFAALSPDFRQIVELVDLDGLAYQEAADVLDIPVGTVMSRLHRARRKIRAEIAERGLESERVEGTDR